MVSFALQLKPSTTPADNEPCARIQFSRSGRRVRRLLANFVIGSSRDRIVRVVHSSRNLPTRLALRYSQNRRKSSRNSHARTVRRFYVSNSFSVTVCLLLRFCGRFCRHQRVFFKTGL